MKRYIKDAYTNELVEAWEATYKQGQLTLWIFLALSESSKSLTALRAYLSQASDDTIAADDKSLYRSLRRYYAANMVDFASIPSTKGGPPTKLYSLSPLGEHVLHEFIHRNLPVLIHNQQIKEILKND